MLFYCEKAEVGRFFRISSSNSGLFSSKNRENCLKSGFLSLRTIKSDRLLAEEQLQQIVEKQLTFFSGHQPGVVGL